MIEQTITLSLTGNVTLDELEAFVRKARTIASADTRLEISSYSLTLEVPTDIPVLVDDEGVFPPF